jgi:hypothetical protein
MMFPIILLLFLLLLGYLYYKETQESGFMSDEDPETLNSYSRMVQDDESDTEIDFHKSRRWSKNTMIGGNPNLAQTSFNPMDSVSLPVVPVMKIYQQNEEEVVEDIQSQIMKDLMGLELGTREEQTFTADAYNPMELRQAPPGGIPLIYPEDQYSKIAKVQKDRQTMIPAVKQEVNSMSQLVPQSI